MSSSTVARPDPTTTAANPADGAGAVLVPAEAAGAPASHVIGVLSVTPDSVSDAGRYLDQQAAVRHGRELAAAGADWGNVGGESTRPGADRTPAGDELRVLPVVTELARCGISVCVGTMRADMAATVTALRVAGRFAPRTTDPATTPCTTPQ